MCTFALRDVVKEPIQTLTHEIQRSQIIGVGLAKTVPIQAEILKSKLNDTVWKEQINQIADFMGTIGYKMSFDKDNKLVLTPCEIETEKVFVPPHKNSNMQTKSKQYCIYWKPQYRLKLKNLLQVLCSYKFVNKRKSGITSSLFNLGKGFVNFFLIAQKFTKRVNFRKLATIMRENLLC
jgi:hypothetical protein